MVRLIFRLIGYIMRFGMRNIEGEPIRPFSKKYWAQLPLEAIGIGQGLRTSGNIPTKDGKIIGGTLGGLAQFASPSIWESARKWSDIQTNNKPLTPDILLKLFGALALDVAIIYVCKHLIENYGWVGVGTALGGKLLLYNPIAQIAPDVVRLFKNKHPLKKP